jgi:branched-subunit amino acid transport protein
MNATTLDLIWPVMVAGGIVTFLIRYSFIAAEGHYRAPGWFVRLLPFVPIAVLAALTVPALVLVNGDVVLGAENARAWAGVVATAVAARWRNTLLTIGAGFAALFVLRALF